MGMDSGIVEIAKSLSELQAQFARIVDEPERALGWENLADMARALAERADQTAASLRVTR
jgi:hypothetical protein